ncbi:MAG: hypothetical protein KA118_02340 [Verrucomicrobia bacterium]|nr:hypothetical protein [Verrucomicrobiota bacterium]
MTLLPGLVRTPFYLIRFWAAGIIAAWASAARGAEAFSPPPLRLAIIGDSLSAEYDSLTGIAGVDDPTVYAAITVSGWESMSWVEVLGRLRPAQVDLGGYGTDLLQWGLLRFSGYENNFAVPGFEASHFEQIVNSTIFSHPQYLAYKQQIADGLRNRTDGLVVWLGANEFRANYRSLCEGNDPVPLIDALRHDLEQVLDFVREQEPGLRVVVVNLPDLGAAPDKQADIPDPLKRARATAATLLANQAIAALAADRGIPVADAFSETHQLAAGETAWIGPVDLFPGSHPDNHPRFQFTRDGLHPNTCLQAIIARKILDAFRLDYAFEAAPITDGEILGLIGIDPMQPYRDWASANALAAGDPGDDPDADRIPNLAEFVFGLDPRSPSPPPLAIDSSTTPVSARYRPDPDRLRLVEVQPEWSANLQSWAPVPEQYLAADAAGQAVVSFPVDTPQHFLRLRILHRAVP